MSEPDFGNEQEMSVHDKEHPVLGPTEEAQDVASLNRIVVPPGAFVDPSNPNTINNTVNVALEDAAVPVSEDYGADIMHQHVEYQPLSQSSAALAEGESGGGQSLDLPEDREEWSKANWQSHAKSLGLATSGNVATIQKRVEDHEAAENERAEFEREVNGMHRDELDKLAADYGVDASEYSNKEDLAAAVMAAYDEQ